MIKIFFESNIFNKVIKTNQKIITNKNYYLVLEYLNSLIRSLKIDIIDFSEIELTTKNSIDEIYTNIIIELDTKGKYQKVKFVNQLDKIDDLILNYPTAIFFTNKSKKESQQLRYKFGFALYSFKDELELFQKEMSYNLCKLIKHESVNSLNNWKTYFLNFKEKYPNIFKVSNSIVLSDNYLFNTRISFQNNSKKVDNNFEIGIKNLKDLIYHLIPSEIETEFQISIFSQNKIFREDSSFGNERDEEINDLKVNFLENEIELWKEEIKRKKPNLINVKIQFNFSKKNIHKRILLSNYYLCWSDVGFSIFNNESITQESDLQIHSYLDNFEVFKDNFEEQFVMSLEQLKRINDLTIIGDQFENRLFNVLKTNNTN